MIYADKWDEQIAALPYAAPGIATLTFCPHCEDEDLRNDYPPVSEIAANPVRTCYSCHQQYRIATRPQGN